MICYVVKHNDSCRRYVGITKSTLSVRKSNHESQAKSGSHNSKFHSALREYGSDAFSWELLAEGSERVMRLLERILIHEWETNGPGGFNTGGGHVGQIRYQVRELDDELYGPPLRDLSEPSYDDRDREIAVLDMLNDLNSIVRYCEKYPISGDRFDHLRELGTRLLKRVDKMEQFEAESMLDSDEKDG